MNCCRIDHKDAACAIAYMHSMRFCSTAAALATACCLTTHSQLGGHSPPTCCIATCSATSAQFIAWRFVDDEAARRAQEGRKALFRVHVMHLPMAPAHAQQAAHGYARSPEKEHRPNMSKSIEKQIEYYLDQLKPNRCTMAPTGTQSSASITPATVTSRGPKG